MKVWNLACKHGHVFEGWFADAAEFESQQAGGLLACPVCGAAEVTRRPTAAHVARRSEPPSTGPAPARAGDGNATEGLDEARLQRAVLKAMRSLLERTEDVGERFADEARRIHHGESAERAIRGRSTPAEAQTLRDEGIEVMALPRLDWLDGTRH